MYPNQGPPNPYGSPGYNQGYPGAAPSFGAGQPYQQQPPFGAGYPQMPMPGMPSGPPSQMPQPGIPQPFNYQSPPMNQPAYPQAGGYPTQPGFPPQQAPMGQPGYPPQQAPMGQPGYPPQQQPPMGQPGYPPQQQPPMGQPGYPPQQPPMAQQQGQPSYPQLPQQQGQPSYPQLPQQNFGAGGPEPMMQKQQNSYQNASQPPQQQPAYGSPAYGQPQQFPSQRQGRPTLVPAPNFDAPNDAAALRKAMKGFGTNEDAIIEVLCRRTSAQRMQIVRTYKTAYGKDLVDDIRSETSGNFENTLVALMSHSAELYARELHEAISGTGTDEDVLIEVMCTMSNYEIREVGMWYQRMFGKNLEQELRNDTSGSFKRLMTSLSCGTRDESMVTDVNAARTDAQELKRAGIDKWGTDESVFNMILCLRNYEQIKLIAQEYEKLTGHPLEKDIKKEFSGDIEDGLLSILRVAQNRPEFFARRLHKSMAGIGTTDKSLIRLVATRCEIDMMDIKEAFQKKYGKSLKSFIKGDTSGHYRHALYALIGENRS